jgi:molybdate transport system permease protein
LERMATASSRPRCSGGRGPAAATQRAGLSPGRAAAPLLVVVAALPLLLYLFAPPFGVIVRAAAGNWCSYVVCPRVVSALRLSLLTASTSAVIVIVIGTPVAYWLSHYEFRGKDVIDTLIDLPLALPPVFAGFALLLLFGKQGIGRWLEPYGLRISLTMAAVIMAQVFVASPFYVKQARAGFEGVPRELRLASATLGAGAGRTFLRVTAPLAAPALLAGAVMSWARALGEFGACLMFAGAFEGRTETMPVAIYTTSTTNLPAAIALAAMLLVVSFAVLILVRRLVGRTVRLSPVS